MQTRVREPKYSNTTFRHVNARCWTYFNTLNQAQKLYLSSMRIPLERAPGVVQEAVVREEPLQVRLRIDLKDGTASHTLSVLVAPDSVKHFVFKPGRQPFGIPCSPRGSTSVSIEWFADGHKLAAKNGVGDKRTGRILPDNHLDGQAALPWSGDGYLFYIKPEQADLHLPLSLPAYRYGRDECTASGLEGATLSDAFSSFKGLPVQPSLTPSSMLSVVGVEEAQAKLGELDRNVQDVQEVFDAVFAETMLAELGAPAPAPAPPAPAPPAPAPPAHAMIDDVDWTRSYTVTSDELVTEVIRGTKKIYTLLSVLSNTAVDSSWLHDPAVHELLAVRDRLTLSVRARRARTEDVVRVRASFLCIDAIDHVLQHICGFEKVQGPLATLGLSCHKHWLRQLQDNTHNSISMPAGDYEDARNVLMQCEGVLESNIRRADDKMFCFRPGSVLASKVWQHMLLQGLVAQQALIGVPCPNFVYKKRAHLDFSKHSIVRSLLAQAAQARTEAARQRLETQVGAAALLVMLVNVDAEHRLIPPALAERLLGVLQEATAADTTETTSREAAEVLTSVFDPAMHPLVASALGSSSYWTVYKNFASQSQHKYKIIIFFFRRSK
jgi:hypothetical protein